jgi:trigger factor
MTRGKTSQEQAFFQRRIAQLPTPQATFGGVALPSVKVPSLEGLSITAPMPPPVSEDELLAAAEDLARSRARRTPRKYGEKVQAGDEVTIDMLGYVDGKLMPFSARKGLVTEAGAGDLLPWLDEVLLECNVGDSLELPVTYGEDDPVEALRGLTATYLIDVVGAAKVSMPEVGSEAFVHLLSRKAKTLDEALTEVAEMVEGERAADAWDEARERVIDELIRRTEVSIPPALVDEEIRRSWARIEEPYLDAKGFDDDEKREALDGWLDDEPTRIDAQRRLCLGLVLKAIVERDQLTFDQKTLEVLTAEGKARFKLSKAKVKEALSDPATHASLVNVGLHTRALQSVLERSQVTFEGLPGVHRF